MRHEVKIVKFNRKDFLNAKNHIIEIDEWIAVEENDLLHHTSVKSIPDVHVTGTLEFDGMNFVSSDLSMDGTMVVLDSITNEDIDVPFDIIIKVIHKVNISTRKRFCYHNEYENMRNYYRI